MQATEQRVEWPKGMVSGAPYWAYQDEATYRRMAEMPEQHQFYLRFNEVFTGEPTWEDVEMEWGIRE